MHSVLLYSLKGTEYNAENIDFNYMYFLFPDIYGVSIFQFCGRYEYNCYYYDGKLYMNLAKIPCHELVITQVDISNNCLDGYLYDFEGEKDYII